MYTKFEDSGSHKSGRNLWQKILLERKKNVQIKGMISMRMLILSYKIQNAIPNVCTNLKILGFMFAYVEVLRPSQPNGVMSSAASLRYHTFTGQA